MVGGPRLRLVVAVALALVLTACSSGPGGGGDAVPKRGQESSTTVGVPDLHQDVVVVTEPAKTVASPRGSSTTVGGKAAVPVPGRASASPDGSTSGTTTTTTLPPGLPAEKCPEPKTCRYYTFLPGEPYRWPTDADGRATVEYWINPTGAPSSIAPEEIEGAMAAAFATWERAAPILRFVYRGRTDRPVVPHDGMNVVAFDGEEAKAWPDQGQFDIQFQPTTRWVWAPCEQRDGSCTPYSNPTEVGTAKVSTEFDLQSAATHEVGHVLWLGHPPLQPEYSELTMQQGSLEKRSRVTLALGDVLGIRALYPCLCPLPPIYDP